MFRLEIIVTLEGIVEPSGNTTQVSSTTFLHICITLYGSLFYYHYDSKCS
jgi:hypothetical protein